MAAGEAGHIASSSASSARDPIPRSGGAPAPSEIFSPQSDHSGSMLTDTPRTASLGDSKSGHIDSGV